MEERTVDGKKISHFVQIGVTALRDPETGDFLPSVPLYIREEDAGSQRLKEMPDCLDMRKMMEKFKAYKEGVEAIKREQRKKKEALRREAEERLRARAEDDAAEDVKKAITDYLFKDYE